MNGINLSSDGLFSRQAIDKQGPGEPWGKGAGDLNGDGRPDLIVAGHQGPPSSLAVRLWRRILGLVGIHPTIPQGVWAWYRNGDWAKHEIASPWPLRTDIEIADLNRDGRNDVLALTDTGIVAFINPEWAPHLLYPGKWHDLEIADLNRDGRVDLVARNQSLGYPDGGQVMVLMQDSVEIFHARTLPCLPGEGLAIADLDEDGFEDLIVNGLWLRNPGRRWNQDVWESYAYSGAYDWPHLFIAAGNMNGDGHIDIGVIPSEPKGNHYRFSWFENSIAKGEPWVEHPIEESVETNHHFLAARDFDGDGRMDWITAATADPNGRGELAYYQQQAQSGNPFPVFKKIVFDSIGSHSCRSLDLDGDGRPDLFGANWNDGESGNGSHISLWLNRLPNRGWQRHVLDANRPGKALFVKAADLDGDGRRDVVTGAFWYRNPGSWNQAWERHALGQGAENAVVLADFDRDGDIDVLASGWKGLEDHPGLGERILRKLGMHRWPSPDDGAQFVWCENDGHGNFQIHRNIEKARGDFLQGAVMGPALDTTYSAAVYLSWHRAGEGVQRLWVPRNPGSETWPWNRIAPFSQDEALTYTHLNTERLALANSAGSVASPEMSPNEPFDLILGTHYLHATRDSGFIAHTLDTTSDEPDRNAIADIDGDGLRDVVVGFEAISLPGKVKWYGRDSSGTWQKHVIAWVKGPMSLSACDLDADGDPDILVGEHDLQHPESARLLWLENLGGGRHWKTHVLATGDEHHDGAEAVDIDDDGDLDVLSIGWGHARVLLFQNPHQPSAPAMGKGTDTL